MAIPTPITTIQRTLNSYNHQNGHAPTKMIASVDKVEVRATNLLEPTKIVEDQVNYTLVMCLKK